LKVFFEQKTLNFLFLQAHGKIHFQEIHFETNPEFMKTHAVLKNESGIVTSDIETEFMQDLDGKLMVSLLCF
jgi:hypothetical protein